MTLQPDSDPSTRRRPTITDICLITADVDRSVEFYTQKLGFTLRSRMPGFADFQGPGVILALWERNQLEGATGIPGHDASAPGRTVMLACELGSPEEIDRTYDEYRARGVEFASEPRDYPWNARCIYFDGPNGEFWEFFAWYEGGEPGMVEPAAESEAAR
ncbi:VOC family protein [Leucobacter sp. CSA1]|uniref:VOC family protein n=1 Tax=Leucobacter chromiisoli TaxID=2796471 RepID=A0A934UU63_9MICO|nr:VOC family protein [Leucobacter chromiisoli]MBK0418086.1 VOC family protein [Leucobacter chromiisoli]